MGLEAWKNIQEEKLSLSTGKHYRHKDDSRQRSSVTHSTLKGHEPTRELMSAGLPNKQSACSIFSLFIPA